MARYVFDTKTRVSIVNAIANIAAPTVAELNAGTRIDTFLAKDGLIVPSDQNMVQSGALSERFSAQRVGTFGGGLTLKIYRDDAADTVWNLIVYGTNAFVVVRRAILASTAWAAAQKVEVYPVEEHEPIPAPSAENETVTFSAAMAVTVEPNLKATVA